MVGGVGTWAACASKKDGILHLHHRSYGLVHPVAVAVAVGTMVPASDRRTDHAMYEEMTAETQDTQ